MNKEKEYLMGNKLIVTPMYTSETSSVLATNEDRSNAGKTFTGYFLVTKVGLGYNGPVAVGDKITLDDYYNSVYKNYVNEETQVVNEGSDVVVRDNDIIKLITSREISKETISSEPTSRRGQES